jgi:AraC-like DNA-binding protein
MLNAANLLSSTEKSVGEIALHLGYSNISSFSGKFKEYFLMTPLEYRKKSRQKPF